MNNEEMNTEHAGDAQRPLETQSMNETTEPQAAAEASGSRHDALVMCDGYDSTLVNWQKHSCEKKHQCSRYTPKGLRSYALCRNDSEYPYFIEREST